jgi:class 3 adenylate cyclase
MIRALQRNLAEVDIRGVLPAIRVPTLVIHRTENKGAVPENGHYVADKIPGARLVLVPGADQWIWCGDTEPVLEEIEEFVTGVRPAPKPDRVPATVLVTDIVGSTERAAELGDRAWRTLLDEHDAIVRREIGRYRGREIDTTGDGFIAAFDGPARTVECAHSIAQAVHTLGIQSRAGVHTGECHVTGDTLAGIALNIAVRICAVAGPGEVVCSGTVKDLVIGSGIRFFDRGRQSLKGVPGEWQLYAAER